VEIFGERVDYSNEKVDLSNEKWTILLKK